MVKKRICQDEWYPVYATEKASGYGTEVDVPLDLLEREEEAWKYFRIVQEGLRIIYEEAKKKEKLENSKDGIPSHGF